MMETKVDESELAHVARVSREEAHAARVRHEQGTSEPLALVPTEPDETIDAPETIGPAGWTPPTPDRVRALLAFIAGAITPPTRTELREKNRILNQRIGE